MNMGIFILSVCSYYVGWVMAHYRVAHECKLLGKFYVGQTVYTCTSIEDKGETK